MSRSRAQRRLAPPGVVKRRFRPKFNYELFVCGARGHVLVGTDAERVRPVDSAFVREYAGNRWYRCLRCDAWLPLPPPARLRRRVPPDRSEIELPIRGRALRDKIVLRLIAIDRAVHFLLVRRGIIDFAWARLIATRAVTSNSCDPPRILSGDLNPKFRVAAMSGAGCTAAAPLLRVSLDV